MKRAPNRYHFVLWIDGKPRQLHTFDMAHGDKGWYRAITSMDTFRTRENKRLVAVWHKGAAAVLHKRVDVRYEYAEEEKAWRSAGASPNAHLEHHHHSDLWSLYQAIGYDYKRKRYIA